MRKLSINEVDEVAGGNPHLAAFLIGLGVTYARDLLDTLGDQEFSLPPTGPGPIQPGGACKLSCHGG